MPHRLPSSHLPNFLNKPSRLLYTVRDSLLQLSFFYYSRQFGDRWECERPHQPAFCDGQFCQCKRYYSLDVIFPTGKSLDPSRLNVPFHNWMLHSSFPHRKRIFSDRERDQLFSSRQPSCLWQYFPELMGKWNDILASFMPVICTS